MNSLKGIILFFLVLAFAVSHAQEKYWVFFKERDLSQHQPVSNKTYKNMESLGLAIFQESDFGPFHKEVKVLSDAGFRVQNTSRWFNAISVYLSDDEIIKIGHYPFVKEIRRITTYQNLALNKTPTFDGIYLSYPLHQINAGAFIKKGWMGQGVDIGVIDGGFFDAPNDPNLHHLFDYNKVKNVKDFFSPPKVDFYGDKKSDGEIHGSLVTTAIAGFNSEKKQLFGLGLKSNFYFARTESSQRESRIEEDNWIAAIEWLDSLGVRLANSSLGYATGFTNPSESYKPEQMDGKTSLIAQGAKMAVNEKGMILVVSAGNEGENKTWGGVVSTPGDVEEVISVGANDNNGMRMAYSSKGVDFVNFIKPDLTVYSEYGTSLAAPIVTGIVALMLEKKPNLKPAEVKEILRLSGSLATSPNNFVGYGLPDCEKIVYQLENKSMLSKKIETKKVRKSVVIKTTEKEGIVIFHKKDKQNVISQEIRQALKGRLEIERVGNVNQTTVVFKDKLIEIIWRN
ncbi:S8 family serine peptidase [Lacihabitans soyangensis]|uniref:Peptidase S8 n=1 Tax=Lacihabitans soyangensis TaxID=869394 RepID=A0AAE3KVZ6_9BACT|nr:S8 family serine peptidase [Lacihabitans soyangensis]MCP9762040.1 peptidase S8 [Lacihabitans soyangensis]